MSITKPTEFNYTEPQKRIHDSKALHLFQTSLSANQLQLALSKIISLVESKDVPQGVLHKEDLYTDAEIAKYEHDVHTLIPKFDEKDTNNVHNGDTQLEEIYKKQPIVKSIVDFLSEFSKLIDLTPPFEGPRRYGNFACRDWHTKLEDTVEQFLIKHILPYYKLDNADGFIDEIKWYILNSFGSKERLDFGTGHELNFLAFLTGLWKVGILKLDEFNGYDILVIFGQYYTLVRRLITTYTLEPAGSHGVWGLDDHFHIIYILGASQILSETKNGRTSLVSPKLTTDKSVVYEYSTKNLFFNAIAFIYKVKKGAFFEHSPILYDISNVKNWEKILKGLLKMFQVEVIGKFPVVQHFYFGNVLFPWKDLNGKDLPIYITDDEDHDHEDHFKQVNKEWDSKAPLHHNHSYSSSSIPNTISSSNANSTNIPTTAAPWAKTKQVHSLSLQDRINSTSMKRTSSPPNFAETTRAPWAKK